ncbi:FAD-binding domain-containing protein 53 [Elsinoe fawcettii]|nr:FAD-binding domain-containing protein 53 [Elsinoe fawcettii]
MSNTSTGSSDLTDSHDRDVQAISERVKQYHAQGIKYRIQHGSSNSTRTAKKGTSFLNLSHLNRVVHVSKDEQYALVEPNVAMDRLVEATLPHGLVPPVVMEFPGITTGGGYAGTSGESSSFHHGYFDRTLDWVELVLADGSIIRASATSHPDLFNGAAGAVGSLGTTTLVKLRLKPALPFVEVTYHPVTSMTEAVKLSKSVIASAPQQGTEYIDGILFSPTSGAIITARPTATPTSPIQRFSSRSDPWFYLHVQSLLSTSPSTPTTESVPLAEYLFRYDRGGFWVAPMAFDYFRVPFNRLTRWALDDFLHTRMMYTALHGGGAGKEIIIQDLALPLDTAADFTDYTATKFDIWPLWLCPLRTSPGPSFHPHLKGKRQGQDDGVMMNIGLWGWGPKPPAGKGQKEHYFDLNRDLEAKLKELGGMKWLYAKTFFTEEEFWRDHVGGNEWYGELRKKYGAEGMPSVYDKTHTELDKEWNKRVGWKEWVLDVWPLGGVWGLWKAIRSGTYKEARASAWKTFGYEVGGEGKKDV